MAYKKKVTLASFEGRRDRAIASCKEAVKKDKPFDKKAYHAERYKRIKQWKEWF